MSVPAARIPQSESGVAPAQKPQSSRPGKTPLRFDDWRKKKLDWIDKENQAEQWMRWRKWQEILKFFIGEQLIWWDGSAEDGYWKSVELEDGDPYYASNVMKDFVNAVVAELNRSAPQMMVAAKTDKAEEVDAATAAKAALIDEERRIWQAELQLRSLFYLYLWGNTLWYTCWLPESGPVVERPSFEAQQAPFGSKMFVCPQCGMQGAEAELAPSETGEPACPECASPVSLTGDDSPIDMPSFGKPQKASGGNVHTLVPDPMQIKVHLHSRDLSETPYLRWDMHMLRDEAEMLWGEGEYEESGAGEKEHRAIERENETHPGDMTGMGAMGTHEMHWTGIADDKEFVRIKRYWLRKSQYWNYAPPEDIELDPAMAERAIAAGGALAQFIQSDGIKYFIPAGTPFKEMFPKGMYLATSGSFVKDMDDRSIDEEWVHIRYQTVPTKFWGDGAESLVQQSREYNELRSVELENSFHNATPSGYYNPKKYKRGSISGKSRQMVPMENAGREDNPAEFIYFPPARNLGPDIPAQKQSIKGDMQLHSSAPVGDAGIPGVNNKTATGMEIVRDWTNSKLSVPLSLLNSGRVKRAKQNLTLCQKFWTGERYIKIANENGMDDGRWFKAADIQGDFDITVREGSWQPRSAMEMKDNMLQLLVAGGVPFGVFNPGFPKQAAVVLTRELGFPLDLDGYSVHIRKQRMEIEYIKQSIGVAAQYGIDPIMLTMQAVPVEETDEDAAHIDAIKFYLNTDLGMKEPPEIKAALIEHMHAHEMGMAMKQQKQVALAMMGMPQPPPGAEGEGGPPGKSGGKPNKPPKGKEESATGPEPNLGASMGPSIQGASI